MPSKINYDVNILTGQLKNYCALQEKCCLDIIHKMQKLGISKSDERNVLEILIKENYIDEARYSKSFARGKFKIKKWGKRKIINELKQKKISQINITNCLDEISDVEYSEELDRQLHKKKETIKKTDYFTKKKKIAYYLINKGYESNLVWDKLRELKE